MKNITTVFFTLLICATSFAQNDKQLQEKIARIENGLQPNLQIVDQNIPLINIEERMRELRIPGVSIAVLNNGNIEWAKGYGFADMSEERAVTTETLFLAGSISKPVAALHAHQLAEKGTISLDENVNAYLTSWKVPENEFTTEEKVTLRRILNHTAGLTVWGFPGYDKGDTLPSVVDVLEGKGNTEPVRVYKKPGESWMYSGGGYTIMQLLFTDIEDKSFTDIMQKDVLLPLGMTSSTFENPLPKKYHAIAATGYRSNGNEVEGKWPIYTEMAAAGLWTTPSQLVLWAKEIQQIQQRKQDGLLKLETVESMLLPGMNGHGLGPTVDEFTYGHGGADEGFRAQMTVWKDQPIAVVIMVNSDNGSIMQEIMLSIAKEYQLPGIEPIVRAYHAQTKAELERFAGTYSIPDLGELSIQVKENGLEISAAFISEPLFVLPETDTSFFTHDDGEYFRFTIEDGKATSFQVQRFEATRVE